MTDYTLIDSLVDMFELIIAFDDDEKLAEAIILENRELLKCLAFLEKGNNDQAKRHLEAYFLLKTDRMRNTAESFVVAENAYEFMEGYARFIEYRAKVNYPAFAPTAGGRVAPYQLESEPWMYDAAHGNAYMYCTGFNKIRILDFLGDYSFGQSVEGTSSILLDGYLKKAFEMDR